LDFDSDLREPRPQSNYLFFGDSKPPYAGGLPLLSGFTVTAFLADSEGSSTSHIAFPVRSWPRCKHLSLYLLDAHTVDSILSEWCSGRDLDTNLPVNFQCGGRKTKFNVIRYLWRSADRFRDASVPSLSQNTIPSRGN